MGTLERYEKESLQDILKKAHEAALKCKGLDCPMKMKCWRFIKPFREDGMDHSIDPPYKNNECSMFIQGTRCRP